MVAAQVEVWWVENAETKERRFVTTEEQTLLSTPVFVRGSQPLALAVVVPIAHVEAAKTVVQLAATHLTLWHVFAEAAGQDTQRKSQAALLELLARLQQSSGTEDAALTLVGELQRYLKCETVALGLKARLARDEIDPLLRKRIERRARARRVHREQRIAG